MIPAKDYMLLKMLKLRNNVKKYGWGYTRWSINEFLYEIGSPLQWNTDTHVRKYAGPMRRLANKFIIKLWDQSIQIKDIEPMVDSILKWSKNDSTKK